MTIESELQDELQDAMRARDRVRLDAIRQIRTEVSVRVADPGFEGEIDDRLYEQVIATYIKKMTKATAEYEALGERGAEMAAKLSAEISYLERWLPQKMSEDATRALVIEVIGQLGVEDPKLAGKVTGHVMKEHGDEVDGALVNRLVREELGAG